MSKIIRINTRIIQPSGAPEKVFIVHGEPDASDALRLKIKDTYGWECDIPDFNSKYIV